MQQDNLINPQSVNEVIQTLFGSYEKFVLNMINRRKELEDEKVRLTERLKEIEKEEGFIKSVLTGAANKKKTQGVSPENKQQSIKDKINTVQKEEDLIKKVLIGFHGNKINGKFFNAKSNSLDSQKPQKLNVGNQASSFKAIADFLSFKKDEFNKGAGQELIKENNLYSEPAYRAENSLLGDPQTNYKNKVVSILKNEYLPSYVDLQALDNKELLKANKGGKSPQEFVDSFANKINLEKVQQKNVMRL